MTSMKRYSNLFCVSLLLISVSCNEPQQTIRFVDGLELALREQLQDTARIGLYLCKDYKCDHRRDSVIEFSKIPIYFQQNYLLGDTLFSLIDLSTIKICNDSQYWAVKGDERFHGEISWILVSVPTRHLILDVRQKLSKEDPSITKVANWLVHGKWLKSLKNLEIPTSTLKGCNPEYYKLELSRLVFGWTDCLESTNVQFGHLAIGSYDRWAQKFEEEFESAWWDYTKIHGLQPDGTPAR